MSPDGDGEEYVHDPGAQGATAPDADGPAEPGDRHGASPDTDREFGRRGWLLVGMLVVAFVLVPGALYFLPRAQGVATSFGLSLRDAYLVLPLLPALLLGALAVWATTRP